MVGAYKGIREIDLKCGITVLADLSKREKCEHCKKRVMLAVVPIELVGFCKWDVHYVSHLKEKVLEK